MSQPTSIALADCNNFYVSCERLFRPDLATKPVLVVGNNDGNVIARSNEVKALGVPMGAPLHEVRHLIAQHQIAVFSANFALYGDLSQRVMQTLACFTPALEEYSIDEAFLDVSMVPTEAQADYVRLIRATVKRDVGIPVSIGVAPSKTLAKLASEVAKKQEGVLVLDDEEHIDALLDALPTSEIWGIGGRRAEVLAKRFKIRTALELKRADIGAMRRALSVVVARTVLELRGISCLPLEQVREPKKEICTSRAFGHKVRELSELKEAIATYACRAAEKLRQQQSVAARVLVFLHTNPFAEDLPQYHRSCLVSLTATDDAMMLVKVAHAGIEALYKPGYLYHKAGVVLMHLSAADAVQGSLFELADPQRVEVMAVMDAINRRFGRDTIRLAATGLKRPWAMRQKSRSPRYTTHWEEIPTLLTYRPEHWELKGAGGMGETGEDRRLPMP
jgi:DNA polymerase V